MGAESDPLSVPRKAMICRRSVAERHRLTVVAAATKAWLAVGLTSELLVDLFVEGSGFLEREGQLHIALGEGTNHFFGRDVAD